MDKIIFDFDGMPLEVEGSIHLTTLIAGGNIRFRFHNELYDITEKTIIGIEQQAINDEKKRKLLADPSYDGEFPKDVIELHVKLKKL